MRDKSVSTAERRFVADCITAKTRIDGRQLSEAREVSITLGPSWGFAEVSLDRTTAIASTTVDAITPSPDRPNEGLLTLSAELSPTCSEATARTTLHRSAGPSPGTEVRNCLEKFVREARALDTEALCILAGVKVWSVRVNVDIINDDGNCIDACVLAVLASLMHARRPEITVTGKEVRVHSVDEREPVPLPVHHVPLAVTFALFGAGKPYEADTVALDPVKREEVASGGSLSFAFNAQGEVCGVYKAGGLPVRCETFLECSDLGESRALQLTAILKRALADASAQHPLATVRPMLVHPEPVAQIRSKEGARAARERLRPEEPLPMWNATPVEDVPPPPALDSQPVRMNTVIDVDEAVDGIFEDRKQREVVDVDMEDTRRAENKAIVDSIVISDDEESSSDDDLQSAVISRPRGGGRR